MVTEELETKILELDEKIKETGGEPYIKEKNQIHNIIILGKNIFV